MDLAVSRRHVNDFGRCHRKIAGAAGSIARRFQIQRARGGAESDTSLALHDDICTRTANSHACTCSDTQIGTWRLHLNTANTLDHHIVLGPNADVASG